MPPLTRPSSSTSPPNPQASSRNSSVNLMQRPVPAKAAAHMTISAAASVHGENGAVSAAAEYAAPSPAAAAMRRRRTPRPSRRSVPSSSR